MLLNLSNHSSSTWQPEQLQTAEKIYGMVQDMDFPLIDPKWNGEQVRELANDYKDRCLKELNHASGENNAVHLMGELTFCFVLVRLLQKEGITVIASTTRRYSENLPNSERKVRFEFERFRKYPEF